jgi:hypothetical protein
MTNTLYEEEITGIISKISTYDGLVFYIGDKRFEIHDVHYQDCCEHVYASFDDIIPIKNQIEGKASKFFQIEGVKDMGFLLCFSDDPTMKVLINCYNEQNGYYSDDLSITLNGLEINLEGYKINNIY